MKILKILLWYQNVQNVKCVDRIVKNGSLLKVGCAIIGSMSILASELALVHLI